MSPQWPDSDVVTEEKTCDQDQEDHLASTGAHLSAVGSHCIFWQTGYTYVLWTVVTGVTFPFQVGF